MFEEVPAALARLEKGLVVEPGREDRRQQAVDRRNVEAKRRPDVLRMSLKAVENLDFGRLAIGFTPAAVPQGDHAARLLRAGRHHAARPVIFEAGCNMLDVLREQRGGEAVAGKAADLTSVEAELYRLLPINQMTAFFKPIRAHISASLSAIAACAPTSRVERIWWSDGIALDREDRPAPGGVLPVFDVSTHRIGALIDVGVPLIRSGVQRRKLPLGIAEIGEFVRVAVTANGAMNEHQCNSGDGPTPFSSITRPWSNRCRVKAALSSCGSSRAMVWAKHQPEAGVALKPP